VTLLAAVSAQARASAMHSCDAPVAIPERGVEVSMQRSSSGHLMVNTSLDGVSRSAVLDTGALGVGGTLHRQLADQISPNDGDRESISANGAHASATMQRATLSKVSLGAAEVDDLMFLVTPQPLFPDDGGAGLIGSRFLCQFMVDFDFADDTLRLRNRDTAARSLVDDSWIAIPFRDCKGTGGIVLDMQINGVTVPAVLDTGSTFTGINWAAAGAAGVTPHSPRVRELEVPGHGLGASGTITTHEAGFELSLSDGQFQRRDDAVRISDATALKQIFGDQPGMIVGLDYFRDARLVVDYSRSKLFIKSDRVIASR
jgi:predicted aspartyl protease